MIAVVAVRNERLAVFALGEQPEAGAVIPASRALEQVAADGAHVANLRAGDALRGLRERGNPARVLVITSYTDPAAVLPAVRSGAAGYVYKDVDPPALAAAIRAVHAGHVLLYYAGHDPAPLEQYVALTAVAGVLARFGGLVVLNESGRTSFPAAALSGHMPR